MIAPLFLFQIHPKLKKKKFKIYFRSVMVKWLHNDLYYIFSSEIIRNYRLNKNDIFHSMQYQWQQVYFTFDQSFALESVVPLRDQITASSKLTFPNQNFSTNLPSGCTLSLLYIQR